MSTQVITTPPKRKPYVRVVATALVAGLIGVGYVAANRGKPAAQHAPATQPAVEVAAVAPAEVGVERIVPRSLSEPIRVTGTLRTDETVVLSTKATGLVRAVYAKEGDRVRRGQLLVEIDDTDLRAQRDRALAAVRAAEAQIREAEAAVRVASARLQQSRTTRNMGDVASQSEYRRAQQALVTSRTRLSQARSLAGIAGTESETRVASARAGLQAARERLTALREGSRRQERAAAEATVTRAQTQVSRMRSMLSRREQLLREGAVAAEVVDNARRDFEAAVADREAAQQQLSLVLEGPRGEEIRAQEEVIRQAEAAVRDAEAYRARGQISNQDVEAAQSAVSQS
ncbi:MAG TPA: biotin/lipoyl-binding protein, partial [Armatimonadota bacterium]|nr:biotin/lipoyl-binding protein [Armatimonadota bacterium]